MLWVEGKVGKVAWLGLTMVPSSERTMANPKLFCDLAIAKRCAILTRFDCFNYFLNRIHIG
jgi:hypothetical protein